LPVAYSYIRFSTSEQKKGDSLRRQTELSERYASTHGLTLDNSVHLHDLGLSAFDRSNIERGALGGFLEAVKRGQVAPGSFLLVESLDRLSRDKVLAALEIFISIAVSYTHLTPFRRTERDGIRRTSTKSSPAQRCMVSSNLSFGTVANLHLMVRPYLITILR
jgi:hypothetical protein